jgi:hypothetical protein
VRSSSAVARVSASLCPSKTASGGGPAAATR